MRALPPNTPPPASGHLRFSRPETFSSTVSSLYRPVVLESAPRTRFSGGIEARRIDDLLLSRVEATTHEFRRVAGDIGAAGPQGGPVKVFALVEGVAVLRQDEHEVVLEPGGLGLVDTARTYDILGDDGFDCLILMLPGRRLGLRPDDLAELSAARFDAGALDELVVPYLSGLARNLPVLDGAAGRRVAHTTVELLSALLQAQLGPRLPRARIHRAELTERAQMFVREHLDDRALSPGAIAEALHVSPRYVHSLFSSAGTTVSAFVRAQRLEASRRDLADPHLTHLAIADVAARRGFSDGAHFTRAFKDAYGVTPSAFRRTAALPPPD
ncbi:AraC family transcriptional regulator [Streptomyces sp. SHP 1-2]|uniref:AraC family transcriptional regulator n=1 Tax=Streptomyces sp. SHP 1-2 TaxID=2769489 RepID=UPI0022387508|nr:AraC family transcriptional regulator [Streptomyces sp. SHP 1-2]MCW5249526.1 AraC family transcriptional regulator [Streptomyces sp. SHP 1-2]